MFGLSKIELILLGAFALVIAVGGIFYWAVGLGESKVEAKDAKATISTQGKIDDAQTAGPRTSDDVDKRLLDHKF